MNLIGMILSSVLALGPSLAGCGENPAGPTSEPGVVVSTPTEPAPDSGPLWHVLLDHGMVTAINRPAAVTPPLAPVDAELWIVADVQGGFDTMRIALTIDCQAATYAFDRITSYNGTTLIEDVPAVDTAAYSANPDTPYAAMMAHVCTAHDAPSQAPDFADFRAVQATRAGASAAL